MPGGTMVVMSPTGVGIQASFRCSDNDLTWLMVPSDVQRAPLMISQIGVLEQTLKAARNKSTIKLGVVVRKTTRSVSARARP